MPSQNYINFLSKHEIQKKATGDVTTHLIQIVLILISRNDLSPNFQYRSTPKQVLGLDWLTGAFQTS